MFVNDPARMCIVPITWKYYSDMLAIVPIMSKKLFDYSQIYSFVVASGENGNNEGA